MREEMGMQKRGMVFCAAAALLSIGLAGCSNTQGTASNPDLTKESVNYKGNEDPQNTGAGGGSVGKPVADTNSYPGGESPSQAKIKGTDTEPTTAQAAVVKKQ
jgi:hypothetical protein